MASSVRCLFSTSTRARLAQEPRRHMTRLASSAVNRHTARKALTVSPAARRKDFRQACLRLGAQGHRHERENNRQGCRSGQWKVGLAVASALGAFCTRAAVEAEEKSPSRTNDAEGSQDELPIGLCQIHVGEDKEKNIEAASRAVRKAVERGAKLVVLPEMFNCPYANASFPVYAEVVPSAQYPGGQTSDTAQFSPTLKAMTSLASELGIYLIAGSMPERVVSTSGEDKLFNTCFVIDPQGDIIARHRKVHLFDIDVPGKIRFIESETLTAGEEPTVVATPWGKIGVGICYDMRFAELGQLYADRGCRVVVYPGAFNTTTGPAHWELLQRARALDNQLFVATCSPARNPDASYQAWGHSTLVDPWGSVVATTGHEEDVIVQTVNMSRVEAVREQIPVRKQKRPDLYSVLDKTLKQ